MSTPTFVVGTGRCGSTMLSNMLREHPKVLSLSEFFAFVGEGGFEPRAFLPHAIDGLKFWSIIAAKGELASFNLRHRVPMAERLYPFDDPAARFSSQSGIPAILQTTLPLLTDEHDALFDILEAEVTFWPTAPIADHYTHLFRWLCGHFDKRIWIERTGTSLLLVSKFLEMFQDARFIHIARDGRDAAISMHAHLAFRLHMVMVSLQQHLGVNPIESSDRSHIDRVPADLLPFLPEHFNADTLHAYPIARSLCGEYWTQQVETGMKPLATLSPDRLLTLRYEDVLTDPKTKLDQLAAFLGEDYIDKEWSTRCAATVRKPRSTWRDLPEEEARALTEACRPGFELLAAAGIHYDV
jgi:hypothetical protein